LKSQISKLHQSSGESESQTNLELLEVRKELSDVKHNLAQALQSTHADKDKIASLEASLANVTSGNEEIIAREAAAAEARAQHQKQLDQQHAQEMQDLEQKKNDMEMKLKTEFNQQKKEWAKSDREIREQMDQLKLVKDREIEALRRYLYIFVVEP
jgi:hypothetical protein